MKVSTVQELHDSVMYATTHTPTVAIDTLIGGHIRKQEIEFAPDSAWASPGDGRMTKIPVGESIWIFAPK